MKFKKIYLSNWRQFNLIDIDFHERVTIITGANGSGKSTILKILAQHLEWSHKFLAVPTYDEKIDEYVFKNHDDGISKSDGTHGGSIHEIGCITYSDDEKSTLSINKNLNKIEYEINVENKNNQIKGVFIHSHRASNSYSEVTSIPATVINPYDSYKKHTSAYKQHLEDKSFNGSPITMMKESLISMASFGIGNSFVKKNEKIENTFLGFIDILKKLLPAEIGFKNIKIEMPNVVLETKSGDFILDSTSGGIMALIDIAWQILLYAQDIDLFTVVIDEPENHLHPAMQRTLLNNLVSAFPNVQFIVVTHSPFIISSIKESNVYALQYDAVNDLKKVNSFQLDLRQKAATANKILREVLGVPVTIPQWADDELQRICAGFSGEKITADRLEELRQELEVVGLSEFYPEALSNIMGNNYHD
ncbi:AAA family ATPase [Rahnella sikkimica]|uniref:AAA+ ATPase domain-containing protein n=1 Tax=Rahnella sikkimica TaxID=1805933 RepID=A0A2L1UQ76_9GAMM|nr:AAA family ATPase [Rahnella sikkimica]AVF35083.1 hypothetical protein BV494_09115 [Rahnella sikkimica]